MAEQEIARIARAALADHGCLRAAIAHRTGVVAVGEASVGDRDLLGAPRAGLRRLQAGDRHAQADGADLEEGALRRRRGLDRPGGVDGRPNSERRATVRCVSTTPTPTTLFRARPRRAGSRRRAARSTRRACCATGRAASAAPIGGLRSCSGSSGCSSSSSCSSRCQVRLRHDRADDGRLGRRLHAALGLAVRGALRRCCSSCTSSATRCGCAARASRRRDRVHPVPRRRDRHAREAARRLRRGQGRPRRARCSARSARPSCSRSASDRTPTCCAAAAYTGFLLNLFNLLPIVPLDGGRAMARLHPPLWIAGIAGLAALVIWHPNAILILILFLGGMEAWKRLRAWRWARGVLRHTKHQRIAVGAYLGLAARSSSAWPSRTSRVGSEPCADACRRDRPRTTMALQPSAPGGRRHADRRRAAAAIASGRGAPAWRRRVRQTARPRGAGVLSATPEGVAPTGPAPRSRPPSTSTGCHGCAAGTGRHRCRSRARDVDPATLLPVRSSMDVRNGSRSFTFALADGRGTRCRTAPAAPRAWRPSAASRPCRR